MLQFITSSWKRLIVLPSSLTSRGLFHGFSPASTKLLMSVLMLLRACIFFLSILVGIIASPCQQKRDTSSLNFFTSDDISSNDESSTLAFATTADADLLSSDNIDPPGVSIFSSSTDGSRPAALNGHASDPDSATGFVLDGEPQAISESLFLGPDSEGFPGQNLLADLPNFGGITDFSFKDLENEKSCPPDGGPTTQSGQEKVPGTTNEINPGKEERTEDERKCPSVGGKQSIALCCISVFEIDKPIQSNCYRRT